MLFFLGGDLTKYRVPKKASILDVKPPNIRYAEEISKALGHVGVNCCFVFLWFNLKSLKVPPPLARKHSTKLPRFVCTTQCEKHISITVNTLTPDS